MAATTTLVVPHLGGTTVGYRLSSDAYDVSKPTAVLVNSMCTTVSLFNAQFENKSLTDAMNLLAIEPLGHGSTSCLSEHFTYWDTSIVILQALDKLGIDKAFVLGTSQGGWIVTRIALLAPDRILGLLVLGTSMDYESSISRENGCWDPLPLLEPFKEKWTSDTPTPDFEIDDEWCGNVIGLGFADSITPESAAFWNNTIKAVYKGDEGRKKVRMAAICLVGRDGLLLRVQDVKCPVHWLQGTKDLPFGTKVQEEHLKLFTSAPETKLTFVEGGHHYLNATNPKEVNEALLNMVNKHK